MHTSADWLTSADLPPGMRRSGEPIGLKLFHPQIRSSVGDTDILFVDKVPIPRPNLDDQAERARLGLRPQFTTHLLNPDP
jgi:hypothetical protein